MSSRQRSRLLKSGGKDLILEKELAKLQNIADKDGNSQSSEEEEPVKNQKKLKKKQKKTQQKLNFTISSSSNSEDTEGGEDTIDDTELQNTNDCERNEKKLDKTQPIEEEVENDDEDGVEEEDEDNKKFTLTKQQNFVFESEGSQHESSAESESDLLNLSILEKSKAISIQKPSAQVNEDENKLLEEMIEQNQQFLSLDSSKNTEQDLFDEVVLLKLTDIDVKALDLDNIIRSRFGRNLDPNNAAAAGLDGDLDGGDMGGRGRRFRGLQAGRPNLHIAQKFGKKFIFGQMKEDWVKPPSFIGGGVGMEKLSFDVWEEDSDLSESSDDQLTENENDDDDNDKDEVRNDKPDSIKDTKSISNTDTTESKGVHSKVLKPQKRGQNKKNSRRFYQSKQSRHTNHHHHQQKRSAVMNESSKHIFSFHYSKEYQQLSDQYEILLHSNDPNYLIMFLVNHPYFIRGFYDLSLIYLQMGQLDKTLHLLRHCIYCYENAFLESFKVCYGHNYLPIDSHQENQTFYAVFIKYLQLITNQGYYSFGLDLIRILLALNPNDSSEYGLLLLLDYYCLMNKRYDLIFQMTGMKNYCKLVTREYQAYQTELQTIAKQQAEDGEENEQQRPQENVKPRYDATVPSLKELHGKIRNYPETGEEALFTMLEHWKYSYIIDVEEVQLEAIAGKKETKNKEKKKQKNADGDHEEPVPSVQDDDQTKQPKKELTEADMLVSLEYLPNWWFSLALSCYLGHDDQKTRRKYQQERGKDTEDDDEDEDEEDENLFDESDSDEDHSTQNTKKNSKRKSKKQQNQQQSKEEPYLLSFYTLEHAKVFLIQAIMKWPTVYLQILQECFPHQSSADYKFLMNHEFFRNPLASIKFPSTYNISHMIKCQLIRMKGIYTSKTEIMEWFFQTGLTFLQWMDHPKKIVGTSKTPPIDPSRPLFPMIHAYQQRQLTGLIDETERKTRHSYFFSRLIDNSIDTHQQNESNNNDDGGGDDNHAYKTLVIPTFQRYSHVKEENFLEEFPIFPNNLELIQPHLLDLTIFNGQMKFPELKKFIFVLKKYQKKFQSYQQSIHNNWWAQLWQWLWGKQLTTRQLEGRDSWQWNLDLSIPLIQIFILSFLPWYRVAPVVRNP